MKKFVKQKILISLNIHSQLHEYLLNILKVYWNAEIYILNIVSQLAFGNNVTQLQATIELDSTSCNNSHT